jgi:hypothetical protein
MTQSFGLMVLDVSARAVADRSIATEIPERESRILAIITFRGAKRAQQKIYKCQFFTLPDLSIASSKPTQLLDKVMRACRLKLNPR